MKQYLISTASILLAVSCSHTPKDAYIVEGSIDGLPDSTVLVLTDITAEEGAEPLAEAVATGGTFKFQGVTSEPRMVTMKVKDHYGSYPFMIDNASISLTGTVLTEDASDGKKLYSFNDVKVTGSPAHEVYLEKTAGRRQLDSAFMANRNQYADVMELLTTLDRNEPRYDSLMKSSRYIEMSKRENELFKAFDTNYRNTVEANKESFWGPLLMYAMVTYISPEQRDMYEQFSDSAKNTFYGKHLYKLLYPVGRPGDRMPHFKAKDINGQEVDIMEFCKGKKAVLLDFWASWCRPCRKEIPSLKQLYAKYADKGFDILSISIDKDEQAWRKAVGDENLNWTNIRDTDQSISNLYKVQAVPTLYVMDANGCLAAENLHGEELAAKITQMME